LPNDGIWVFTQLIFSFVPDTIHVFMVSSPILCQRFDSDHRTCCDING
jgi:hypothetical protein